VIGDNPRLTCRLEGGRDPLRIVVDAALRTSRDARIYRQRSSAPTLLVTTTANLKRAQARYARRNVEVIGMPSDRTGVDLGALMRELAARGCCKVLLEGGAHLAAAALRTRLVDRVAFFVAPKIFGAGIPAIEGLTVRKVSDAIAVSNLRASSIGSDWLLEGEL
jgi:diaminohydroxyphosphoribosylaminopyrimidine deaminase / 5-amino-6-(5-phosphoribosylamino)uracil reductase